jgi:sugar phosphate isomerase/epimerase
MRLSIFTLILKSFPLPEVIETAKEIGYEAVELMGRDPHLPVETTNKQAKEINSMIKDTGLAVSCLATYTGGYSNKSDIECQQELDQLKRFVELATILDCQLVRHAPGGPREGEAELSHYQRAAEWMQKAADFAASAGVKVVMEIHDGGLIESAYGARKLLDIIDRDNVGVIHDAGNMYISKADFGEESVKVLGEKIFHVHVKDELKVEDLSDPSSFRVRDEFYCHKLLGQGGADHLPLFKALIARGYDGYLSAECHGAMDPIETAKHEYKAIKELIAKAKGDL